MSPKGTLANCHLRRRVTDLHQCVAKTIVRVPGVQEVGKTVGLRDDR